MRASAEIHRRTFRVLGLGTLGAALLLAGPLAAKGVAGSYVASECGTTNPYSEAQYSEYAHHFFGVTRDCRPGGSGLGVALPQAYGSGYGSEARFQVTAPHGTHIGTVSGAQMGVNADGWYVDVEACGGGSCSGNFYVSGDGYWRLFGSGPGEFSSWYARLVCLAGSCYGSTAAGLHVLDAQMTMYDDVAPTVAFGGASELLDGQVQRGVGHLHLLPSDIGAGLTSAWVLVDDQEIARQTYACGGRPMQPCPLEGGMLDFALDTQASPFRDGINTVQACAADFGVSPNVTCSPQRSVRVDNSCTPSGVPGGANLSALFAGNDKDVVDVRAGQGALLRGQLTDGSGQPVEHAFLCMKEGVPGQGLEEMGTVRTDSEGRYRYGVAPGPNRRLEVGYRYNRRQLQREAQFLSRVRPALKLSPRRRTSNGNSLRLYGSLPGPYNDGRVVILQAAYPHSRQWKTFAKARSDGDGRYLARYRFSATFVTTRYRMRAVVPEQNGYPYTGGASRVRRITVAGSRRR